MTFKHPNIINGFDLQFRSQITDFNRRKKYAKKELNICILKAVLDVTGANARYKKTLAKKIVSKLDPWHKKSTRQTK